MSAVLKELSPRIRPMRESDLRAVANIEREAYEFPWTHGIFSDCLRVGYSCWVLELERDVVGYGILSVGAGEAHILNICLERRSRRRGWGRHLLDRLVQLAQWHHAEQLFLEVRPSNVRAIDLYRRNGFRTVGRRPNYYPHPAGREDAVVMSLRLNDTSPTGPARLADG